MNLCRLVGILLASLLLASATGATELGYEEAGPTRGHCMLKSTLWPGLGQILQGRHGRGALWAGGAAALAAGVFFTHMQYHSAALDYNNTRDSYERAVAEGWETLAQLHFDAMQEYYPLAEDRKSYRSVMEVALVFWWGGNLVDTWLFAGKDSGDGAEHLSVLPGRVQPVLHRGAAGLAWTMDF